MGSTEFQKEYITYLEDENNKLRNKVSDMKESLEKVITNSTKNELESVVYDVMNVCCAMTDEIDEFYEQFSATSAALCSVLKRKSQMIQLSKKLSTLLHSVEQIDPELELIDANNMAFFAKRFSDGKISNQKKETAKVSPMINGLKISTDPRIRLNRVTHEITNRHRINPEPPQLSPVVEMSPVTTPPRNQQIFFREIQISVPCLNINSDGQVVNRNNEESPRSSNCVKKRKKSFAARLSQVSPSNRRSSEPPAIPEEESEELATEEEKENLNNTRNSNGEEVLRVAPGGENSVIEEDKEEEQCSHSSSAESSPESSKAKNNSLSSPAESVDPLEGPSWLLDRPIKRESGKGSNFKFVNVRRQRNRIFSGSSRDNSTDDSQKLHPVIEQNEPDESDEREEGKSNEKKNDISAHFNLDTSDMEMTECLPVIRHDVNNQIKKNLPSQEKVATPITESSAEIDSSFVKSEASLNVTERKRIEESIEEEEEEEEDENITTAATYGSDGSKLRNISNNSTGTDGFNNINERTLKVVLEKRESLAAMARSESVKSLPTPKSHAKDTSSDTDTKIIDVKKLNNNVNSGRSSPRSPEKVENIGSNNNTPLALENLGRPKREAAKRCLEQKVWILGTPEDDRNKNKNKNFKMKRKPKDEVNSSRNDKKKHQKHKNDKEDESDVDTDTSTQDSVPSSPPPKNPTKSAKTPNVENSRTVDESLGGSASILKEDETKKKRKVGPVSSKFSTFDETNRTMDQSNFNNNTGVVIEEEGRRKRRAAPVSLKEPSLNQKMRRNP